MNWDKNSKGKYFKTSVIFLINHNFWIVLKYEDYKVKILVNIKKVELNPD